MSILYKKVKLLVSRHYSHGGDGLERGGLVFFRSMHEYQRLASERNWNDPTGKSFGTSWCVKPIEVEALIQHKHHVKFLSGEALSSDKVFFAGANVDMIKNIGGW